jgi:hypothetical protein
MKMGSDAPLSPPHLIARKAQLVAILERLCEALELTPTQFELAKQRYEAVGAWLAASPDPRLRTLSIYLQGSTALGTTVKPLGRNEHDVDLVGHVAGGGGVPPVILKKLIGDRLHQNGHYRSLLEEMPRCWRLNYAGEFHQDITLRRAVQIGKRHRDVYFDTIDPARAPISVILTTLLARSYEYCVTHFVYDTELDLLYDIVRHMPDSIESQVIQGRRLWFIWNETTNGENFAEKWNNDPRRAEAFFGWHQRALHDLEVLAATEGLDQLSKGLRGAFGQAPANKAMDGLINEMSDARRNGRLGVTPGVGLSIGSPRATGVRSNTFFGAL